MGRGGLAQCSGRRSRCQRAVFGFAGRPQQIRVSHLRRRRRPDVDHRDLARRSRRYLGGQWIDAGLRQPAFQRAGWWRHHPQDRRKMQSTVDTFVDYMFGSCTKQKVSDTGWGATINSNFCIPGSTTTSLGVVTRSLRREVFERTGPGCSGTMTISLMKGRSAKCPPNYVSCATRCVGGGMLPAAGVLPCRQSCIAL